jgi:hypothetical protein
MEKEFREWLIKLGKTSAANNYPGAINQISKHYLEKTGIDIDIYAIRDQHLISEIAHDYKQSGRFSDFGYEQHGRFRAAIVRYSEFFVTHLVSNDLPEIVNSGYDGTEEIKDTYSNNFAYEKDLQTTLCAQISELFPEYQIYGNGRGIEYSIGGKRVDVLLEHENNGSLLAVELKSGLADYKVFGQISMYLGLLKEEFPNKDIQGVIVAGAIDQSLKMACLITDLISLKVYRMTLELEDA